MLNSNNLSLNWARTRQIELTIEHDATVTGRRFIDTPKRLPKIRTRK